MSRLTLTHIDDRLMKAVELRAKVLQQSIEQTACELLELGLKLDAKGRVAVSRHIRAMQSAPLQEDSAVLIRRERDGVSENELTPEESLRLVRETRRSMPDEIFPDSTPGIRADRDTR